MKPRDLLIWGAVAAGIVWYFRKQLSDVAQIPAEIGSKAAGTLFDFFHQEENARATSTIYKVWFPDGSHHPIDSYDVSQNGAFSYGGKRWIIKRDTQNQLRAVPA